MADFVNGELSQMLERLSVGLARSTEPEIDTATDIPGLLLFQRVKPSGLIANLYEPCICVLAQGAKRVHLGDDTFVYDPRNYLITSLHLPAMVQVIEASREKPFLGLSLVLDLREISKLMAESQLPLPRSSKSSRGMATGEMTVHLLDAFQRLVGLLDSPEDIPVLAPVIQREIFYRLLVGDQGKRLRQIAAAGSQGQNIARTVEWLKQNFKQAIRVEALAEQAGMSVSTFHHHFRSLTAMSPLQYQKQLRLQEARHLMLTEHADAASAGFEVGYESPSQFSREYSRAFGAPPLRDINRLRQSGEIAVE